MQKLASGRDCTTAFFRRGILISFFSLPLQLFKADSMMADGWDEANVLDQELRYDATEFFEMLKSLQKREKFAKGSGDLQELMSVIQKTRQHP